ncbi:MAG: hypothetical protein K2X27_28330 [Candidatus Obscuribacterales bacterium]|nr:hypothetical protein [Candidatus Obscuribacterales bacterium]
MDFIIVTYISYLIISISMTIWIGRTLAGNGQIFLLDVFAGNKALAASVNRLLEVGFYLINLGYVSLVLRLQENVNSLQSSIEALSGKVGVVLLVLGFMHFFNLFVFSRIRANQVSHPPVGPDEFTEIGA